MTTDITELAQSLKAAAEKWQEAWGKYDKVEITIAEFIRAANQYESIVKDPANVLALVEALEKAQKLATQQGNIACALFDEVTAQRKRIAELESRTVKLPKLKMLEDYLAEVAIEERKQILVGVKLEFHRACVAASIKVEAE